MEKERLLYPDYIRTIACIFVIVIHVTASGPWYSLDVHSGAWTVLMLYNSLVRSAVPIFVMLSGMMLLNLRKKCDIAYLWTKILNLFLVYLCWSTFYAVVYMIENYSAMQGKTVVAIMKSGVLYALGSKYHLWFLPMIIGIYLLIPCLRKIVEDKKVIEWFLLLFVLFGIFRPFVLGVVKHDVIQSVVNRIPVEAVVGYAGYFVMGYYLSVEDISKRKRIVLYISAIITVCISGVGSVLMARQHNQPQGFMTSEFSPSTFLMGVSIFLMMKEVIQKRKKGMQKLDVGVKMLAQNSLGIYLLHVFWLELLEKKGINATCVSPVIGVPLLTIGVLVLSFGTSALLRRNKYFRKIM